MFHLWSGVCCWFNRTPHMLSDGVFTSKLWLESRVALTNYAACIINRSNCQSLCLLRTNVPQKNCFLCFLPAEDLSPWLPFFLLSLDQPGKSETYLEAIRKNIEWLKKHSKEEGKDGETKCLNSRYTGEKHGYRHKFCVSAQCPPCPWIHYTIFVLTSVSSLLPILFSLLNFKRFVYLTAVGYREVWGKGPDAQLREGTLGASFIRRSLQSNWVWDKQDRYFTPGLMNMHMSSRVRPNYS